MKSLQESVQEAETKKRSLEEEMDQLSEEIAKERATGLSYMQFRPLIGLTTLTLIFLVLQQNFSSAGGTMYLHMII